MDLKGYEMTGRYPYLYKNLFLIVLCLLLLACNFLSFPASQPISSREYIIGIWVPSIFALEFTKETGIKFSEMKITFTSDGIVTMTNIPTVWLFQGSSNKDFYSGQGTWMVTPETTMSLYNIKVETRMFEDGATSYSIDFEVVLGNLSLTLARPTSDRRAVSFEKCYPRLHATDDILKPLMIALEESPREKIGFSPIDPKAVYEIQGDIGVSELIGLDIFEDVSHFVYFRLKDGKYVWVSESEYHIGPGKWVDYDAATWEDRIVISYQTEQINGGPVNHLYIDYRSADPNATPDPRINNDPNVWYTTSNLDVVRPVLEEWKNLREGQPPFPQYLCP